MASLALSDPKQAQALTTCRSALQRIANYVLDPAIDERMLELGERKEFLAASEHAELDALVRFSQERTIEKLEAELALKQLQAVYPDAMVAP
jgi:hypothetical protein